MGWNTDIEPKRVGWYFCTIEDIDGRFVAPLFRYEYLTDIFRWKNEPMGKDKSKPYEWPVYLFEWR